MQTSFNRHNPRGYSLRWAEGIVKTWCRAHARVTEELWKYPYFSVNNLADLLINHSQDWYYLKAYVQKVEELLRHASGAPKTTTQALSSALKFFPNQANATGFAVLTGCLVWSTLWEPIE